MATNGLANGNDALSSDHSAPGAIVHRFDPESSPEEKAAFAGQARDKLKPVNGQSIVGSTGSKELPIAKGDSTMVPTIRIQDTDAPEKSPAPDVHIVEDDEEDDIPSGPGALPHVLAPTIPDWYRVGWRQASGIDNPPVLDQDTQDRTILETFLSEQFYGDWYHNAAVIILAVLGSHFLTRFHFGWGWLFILLALCNTYYTTSIRRVRRCARDDIQRELVKTRLASEHESAEWINNFLHRFWLIYEPVLSATIVSSVDQILSTSTPAFLDAIRLTQFTLGNKAPRIDKVRTFPNTEDDIVMMDWGLSFTPNDVSDMTPRQAKNKVNPKIELSIRVGKGVATAAMPILLEDITFSGLMRIRMKLMTNFPHIQIVDICFLEKPVIDYVLKPIGGETFGFDIANLPGLSSFIRETTHSVLGPMMYDPNVFTLNLEQLLSGAPLDTAIGVLQVTLHSARGIKGSKIGGGTPDPFVSVALNGRPNEVAHTKYKTNTYNPTWSETKFILVNSLSEPMILNLWDYNDHRKNTLLGSASFDLGVLHEDASREGIVTDVLKDGKNRGELRFDVSFFPVLKSEEGQEEPPETSVGIVRLTVHQAKDLDTAKVMSGDINPVAKVFLGRSTAPIHVTKTIKHTISPVWEESTEFLCSDRKNTVVTVKIIDDRDFLKDPVVGYMSISLEDLLVARKEQNRDWFPLSHCKQGKLRVSAEWKPLDMAGSLHGADQYSPPIGVVRLSLDRATDVKNVEATLGGKSDPYVRVQVKNETKGRTEVVNNNLNPVWDQIVYVPVHSLKDTLFLECMDYQHLTRDRSLGSAELQVSELAAESDNDPEHAFKSLGVKTAEDPLRQDKGNVYKGKLHYSAQFIPAIRLKGIGFESRTNDLQTADENDDEGGNVSDGSSVSDSGAQAIPDGVTFQLPKTHKKNVKSTDTTHTTATAHTVATVDSTTGKSVNGDAPGDVAVEPSVKVYEGIEMTEEELLTHQSGIIIFNVVSGSLSKKARLEVLLDDGYWPAFSTVKARSTAVEWEYIGEGFVKELDFGVVWLRLNDADPDEKDDIICQWKGDVKPFLKSTLTGPQQFTLTTEDGGAASQVTLEARYVPVPVQLEPRESVNNQGILRVDLIDGTGIRAADRGGKSDPFAVFTLNGQKVFKSDTKKKTLKPEWNETFVVQVPSRVKADFNVEIFDWNQIEQAKSLGVATIRLDDLEPFEGADRELPLTHTKHGDHGLIRVRLMFQPEIIAKSRKNTSTFSTAGRAMTQIGGLPVNAGKGVIQGVTGIFKRDKQEVEEVGVPPGLPSGQASVPIPTSGPSFPSLSSKSSMDSIRPTENEPGTLRVTVLDGKDLSTSESKAYASIRVGDKEFKTKHVSKTATPTWNESFTFAASKLTPKLFVWISDHKTIGKDKLLGDGEVDLWRHLQTNGESAAEVLVELRDGQGLVRLRLEYDSTNHPPAAGRPSSVNSGDVPRTLSIPSPSRFSISRRRTEVED